MSHAGLSESVTHTKPIPDLLSVRIPLTICADLIHACHNFLYLPMDWYSMRFPILFSHNHPDSRWPPGLGDQAPAGTRPWSPDSRWPPNLGHQTPAGRQALVTRPPLATGMDWSAVALDQPQ